MWQSTMLQKLRPLRNVKLLSSLEYMERYLNLFPFFQQILFKYESIYTYNKYR